MINPEIDLENCEISFSAASGEPYKRYNVMTDEEFFERLVMTSEAVNMTRLNDGASVLKNHDTDHVLGKIVRAWIEGDVLAVRARFKKNDPEAVQIFNDIVDGNSQNVSIGYQWDESKPTEENGQKFVDVTRWTCYEVSVDVGVPADPSVGFYRSLNNQKGMKRMSVKDDTPAATSEENEVQANPCANCKFNPDCENPEGERTEPCSCCRFSEDAEDKEPEAGEAGEEPKAAEEPKEAEDPKDGEADESKSADAGDAPADETESDPEKEERSMIRSAAKLFNQVEAGERAIKRGLTAEQFRSEIKKSLEIKSINKGHVYMNESPKAYSLANAMRYLVTGQGAEYEREISDKLYSTAGIRRSAGNSIMVPFTRDFTGFTSAANSGSGLVATENHPELLVEYIRNKIGVKNAKFLTGLTNPITFPAQTGSGSVGWVSDLNSDATSSNPTVTNISLAPHKMAAYTAVGKDLILQGNPDAIKLATDDLMNLIAQKLALTMLKGNASSPAITGVNTATGVQTVTIATIASATWADLLKFGAAVEGKAINGQLEFIMSAADKQTFKGISKDTGSGRFICEDNMIDGYPVSVDGNLATGEIFFGDFSNVIVGQWGGLELVVDPYRYARNGGVEIIASLYADIAVRNPSLFVKRVASAD